MQRKYECFIAGSKDLVSVRNLCRVVFSQRQADTDIQFNVKSFEDFHCESLCEGPQAAYNVYIREQADLTVFVFDCKVGHISLDELRIALMAQLERHHPEVYVFCRKMDNNYESPAYIELRMLMQQFDKYYIDYIDEADLRSLLYRKLDGFLREQDKKHQSLTEHCLTEPIPFHIPVPQDDVPELDLDYEDAVEALHDGRLQDAFDSLITSYGNGYPKAETLMEKTLFRNFGHIDWSVDTWQFVDEQMLHKKPFAYMAYFYKYVGNKGSQETARQHLANVYRQDRQNPYFFLCDGMCYFYGWGCKTDYRKAATRFAHAHKSGLPEALSYRAQILIKGYDGQAIDKTAAYALLAEGMKKKDARSFLVMGRCVADKTFEEHTQDEAAEYYQQAAVLGMSEAWLELGHMYSAVWRQCEDNFEKALMYYTNALMAGYNDAHAHIARLYVKRDDYDRAVQECQRGVREGDALSASVLGSIYEKGIPDSSNHYETVYIPDLPMAWKYYGEAYRLGGRIEDAVSQARLYVNCEYHPDGVAWEHVESILVDAASRPSLEAIRLLVSAMKQKGRAEECAKYLKAGAECGSLEMMYEYATTTGCDMGTKLEYLVKSADMGYMPSIERLMAIYKDQRNDILYHERLEQYIELKQDCSYYTLREYAGKLFYKGDYGKLNTFLLNRMLQSKRGRLTEDDAVNVARLMPVYFYADGIDSSQQETIAMIADGGDKPWPVWYVDAVAPLLGKMCAASCDFYEDYFRLLHMHDNIPEVQKAEDTFLQSLTEVKEAEDKFLQFLTGGKEHIRQYLLCLQKIMDGEVVKKEEIIDHSALWNKAEAGEWSGKVAALSLNKVLSYLHHMRIILCSGAPANTLLMKVLLKQGYRLDNITVTNDPYEIKNICEKEPHHILIFYSDLIHSTDFTFDDLMALHNDYHLTGVFVSTYEKHELIHPAFQLAFIPLVRPFEREFVGPALAQAVALHKYQFIGNFEQDIRNRHILVVDDTLANNLLTKVLITNSMKELGVTLDMAKDFLEAFARCKYHKPDCITMDISMPMMNGFEIVERLKADSEYMDIPIIYLSAYTEKENILQGYRSGGWDYITKPFDREVFLMAIKRALAIKRVFEQE